MVKVRIPFWFSLSGSVIFHFSLNTFVCPNSATKTDRSYAILDTYKAGHIQDTILDWVSAIDGELQSLLLLLRRFSLILLGNILVSRALAGWLWSTFWFLLEKIKNVLLKLNKHVWCVLAELRSISTYRGHFNDD